MNNNDTASVTLVTGGTWTLPELRAALRSVDDVYGSFLTLHLIRQRLQRPAEAASYWAGPDLPSYLARSLPPPDDRGRDEAWQPEPTQPRVASFYGAEPHMLEVNYFRWVFEHRYDFAPDAVLRVKSVDIHSPGHITLEGIGELVREAREFWKDLSFRNRQEKELGELEIARKKLELLNAGLSPAALDYVALAVVRQYEPLRELQRAQKLLPPRSIEGLAAELIESYVAHKKGSKEDFAALVNRLVSVRELSPNSNSLERSKELQTNLRLVEAAIRRAGTTRSREWVDDLLQLSQRLADAVRTSIPGGDG